MPSCSQQEEVKSYAFEMSLDHSVLLKNILTWREICLLKPKPQRGREILNNLPS